MINAKMAGMLLAAFVAGSFVASPELRAFAANTVGSIDIINNSILSADIKDAEVKTVDLGGNAVTAAKIKDGEVKAAEIATDAVGADEIAKDAVGASELKGVDKLIFADCTVPAGNGGSPGVVIGFQCTIAGVDSEDNAIATLKGPKFNNNCFVLKSVTPSEGKVAIELKHVCTNNVLTSAGSTVSIIVYDELPDKVPLQEHHRRQSCIQAALADEKGRVIGIVTRHDVIEKSQDVLIFLRFYPKCKGMRNRDSVYRHGTI